MSEQEPLSPRGTILFGMLFVAVGIAIILMGLDMIPAGRKHAPNWVGALAGLTFLCGGLAVIIGALGKANPDGSLPEDAPMWLRISQYVLGLIIFASFALIGSWIAFGPGERSFGISMSFPMSASADPISGRIAFGIGAAVTWLCTIGFAIAGGRKLLRRGGD